LKGENNMARIKLDTDDVIGGFTVLPSATYLARLVDVTEEESSTGNPMLLWGWSLIDEPSGHELRSYTPLQEHALGGLKQHLAAFGLSGKLDFDSSTLLGKKALLMVSTKKIVSKKTGEEMMANRVESVMPAKKTSGQKPSPTPKGSTAKVEDNDIPF